MPAASHPVPLSLHDATQDWPQAEMPGDAGCKAGRVEIASPDMGDQECTKPETIASLDALCLLGRAPLRVVDDRFRHVAQPEPFSQCPVDEIGILCRRERSPCSKSLVEPSQSAKYIGAHREVAAPVNGADWIPESLIHSWLSGKLEP